MGRLARAFKASGAGTASESVSGAARVGETHGERDSQRLFKKFGLTLSVPISSLNVEAETGPVTLPYLKVEDFLSLLLRLYPKLLFNGFDIGARSEELCQRFWKQYRYFHPEHLVFTFPESEWGRILPVALHGDKGRTYMKQPIWCCSFESVFGLPDNLRAAGYRRPQDQRRARQHFGNLAVTCAQRAADFAEAVDDEDDPCPKRQRLLAGGEAPGAMPHNGRGNVFMTRFLCTVIPSKMFKAHPQLIPAFLKELERSFTQLFHQGLSHGGQVFRVGIIGVKGDYEFHVETGEFQRSYQNIGTVNQRGFCSECCAGEPGTPMMDLNPTPTWVGSLYSFDPWSVIPPLSRIPFAHSKLPSLYRRDPFHTLKYGFLRDLNAGIIIYLAQLKYYDDPDDPAESHALDKRLERAYASFKLFCIAEGKTSSLRKFSRGNFHRAKATTHPFMGGKGADSIICLQYLQFFGVFICSILRMPRTLSC